MAEMSTPENEQLVASVYTKALETRAASRPLGPAEQVVYEIEMLSQEVNSGASFEQYFRWASPEEIAGVQGRLQSLGLSGVAEIARQASEVAFPDGPPQSPEEMDAIGSWTLEQEERLRALADAFSDHNGAITNALARFYRQQHPA